MRARNVLLGGGIVLAGLGLLSNRAQKAANNARQALTDGGWTPADGVVLRPGFAFGRPRYMAEVRAGEHTVLMYYVPNEGWKIRSCKDASGDVDLYPAARSAVIHDRAGLTTTLGIGVSPL